MPWSRDISACDAYRLIHTMTHLKADHKALRQGGMKFLYAEGNVVAIAHDSKLTYDINYKIRLIDTSEYAIPNYDTLKGFLYGLYASNYDITHVFIESLNKLVPTVGNEDVEPFLDWLEAFSQKSGIKYTVSISEDSSKANEGVRKYF